MSNKPAITTPLRIAPQEGPQTEFLKSNADITIFGGSAGGGKTHGLLLEPLRYIQIPRFNCLILRRSSPQIRNPGALWDISYDIYRHLNAKPLNSRLTWKFPKSPSGAEIRFGHIEYEQNKYDYDGSQICMLCFDELQGFSESMFFYMLSRNRSTCGVKPSVKATCNPDSESWLRTFIDWWIGEDGLAIKERSGVVRYFYREDGELVWGSSKNELLKKNTNFVKQYETLKRAYITEKAGLEGKECLLNHKRKFSEKFNSIKKRHLDGVKSVTFISSSVYDNKILLEKSPDYISNLKAMPLVERERLLNGNWNIRPESGAFFNKMWFDIIKPDELPSEGKECRYWDFAATKPHAKNKDPDYTVGIKIRKSDGKYFIISVVRERSNPAEIEKLFLNTCKTDRIVAEDLGIQYSVRWEEEGGSSGKNETYRLQSLLAGYDCRGVPTRGKSKELRAKPLAIQAEIGNVKVLEAEWNNSFLSEMHMFGDQAAKHDDQVDACSGAFNELTSVFIHPSSGYVGDDKPKLDGEELAKQREKSYNQLAEDFFNGDDF